MKRTTKARESVVKTGGVAHEDAEAEDVTRDTYGDSQPKAVAQTRNERIAQADRAAATQGVPGVAVPESAASIESEAGARDEEFQRAEVTGDRTASRRDAERARTKNRETR